MNDSELLFTANGQAIAPRSIRKDAIKRLLAWLPRNARTPAEVGRRALILVHLTEADGARKTQKALAKQLGVTESRASHAIKNLKARLVEFESAARR